MLSMILPMLTNTIKTKWLDPMLTGMKTNFFLNMLIFFFHLVFVGFVDHNHVSTPSTPFSSKVVKNWTERQKIKLDATWRVTLDNKQLVRWTMQNDSGETRTGCYLTISSKS